MKSLRAIAPLLTLSIAAMVAPPALADDIDIFLGQSGGNATAPNVMILIDNSPNWSRAAQHWPDNGGVQGQAELTAVIQVLNYLTQQGQDINVGLSLLTANSGGTGGGGGYIRFGIRNMNVSANNTALQNILTGISSCVNGCGQANQSLNGMAHKDETEAFYEI